MERFPMRDLLKSPSAEDIRNLKKKQEQSRSPSRQKNHGHGVYADEAALKYSRSHDAGVLNKHATAFPGIAAAWRRAPATDWTINEYQAKETPRGTYFSYFIGDNKYHKHSETDGNCKAKDSIFGSRREFPEKPLIPHKRTEFHFDPVFFYNACPSNKWPRQLPPLGRRPPDMDLKTAVGLRGEANPRYTEDGAKKLWIWPKDGLRPQTSPTEDALDKWNDARKKREKQSILGLKNEKNATAWFIHDKYNKN
jgi:hypothetical protein